jgi:hypothetical protein
LTTASTFAVESAFLGGDNESAIDKLPETLSGLVFADPKGVRGHLAGKDQPSVVAIGSGVFCAISMYSARA